MVVPGKEGESFADVTATQAPQSAGNAFSEEYGSLRSLRFHAAAEERVSGLERVLQCVWYDHLFPEDGLRLDDGRPLRVLSPGWWNHGEGPDFKNAQLEIAGRLRTGDVEIHLQHNGWEAHGHHLDPRYDHVLVHVVFERTPPESPPHTSQGKPLPTFLLADYVDASLERLAETVVTDAYPYDVPAAQGACAALAVWRDTAALEHFLNLAGDWRILYKARALRERMDQQGEAQAVYESLLAACGYGPFKQHFRTIARHLPYDRARQLAQQDPLVLETALFQVGGLFPESAPPGGTESPHHARLSTLRRERLAGLRALPLVWRRTGVRPNNYPERRLAGAARLVARTAQDGLIDNLEKIWRQDMSHVARRRAFEALFPGPMGFWAQHCTWTGAPMTRPIAPIGADRVRGIIGNVFVPAALARARRDRDRLREEQVFAFFAALPREPENRIMRVMLPRILDGSVALKMTFRMQQGLLQMHEDWCEPNPSCRNCALLAHVAAQQPSLHPKHGFPPGATPL